MDYLDYLNDPSRWDVLLHPPPGSNIHGAAHLVLQYAKKNPNVRGFVFNDTVVEITNLDADTSEDLVTRYCQKQL